MQYRGSRGVAHTSRLRNGEAEGARKGNRRNDGGAVRAAARAVVESLEQRQLLAAGDPIINEFLADNATGIRDVNLERHDWIEIYNPGASAVNLQGWKLQDSADIWTFPSVSVPANGYLVVFASDKDRAIPAEELHTNFRLSKDGEYLALIKPNGEKTTEFNPYPAQEEDVSYGLGATVNESNTLVTQGTQSHAYVPPNGNLGLDWTQNGPFPTTGWTAGPLGVGFETGAGPAALPAEIESNNSIGAANDASGNFQALSSNLYQLAFKGTLSSATDVDFFNIGQLQSGDILTLSASGTGSLRGTVTSPRIELYRTAGNIGAPTLVASNDTAGPGNDSLIYRAQMVSNDTYFVRVSQTSAVVNGTYDLGIRLENTGTAPTTGAAVPAQNDTSNNTAAGADNLAGSWRAVGWRSRTTGSASSNNTDFFKYQLNAGDWVTVHANATTNADFRVDLLNSAGTPIAVDDGTGSGTSQDSNDAEVFGFRIPSTGTYYIRVHRATQTSHAYTLDVYLSADTAPPMPAEYSGLIGTNVRTQMSGVNATAYVRTVLGVASPEAFTSLVLRMKYDDGFVAYLNGQVVASRNAPGTLDWSSAATGERTTAQAKVFETIDISGFRHLLVPGDNVLAIHGLNRTASDPEFLVLPELAGQVFREGGREYMVTPTPGAANARGGEGVVRDTTFSHDRGFYDAPFQLTITTETANAQIRYTLDGSQPTATSGFVYNGPITISPSLFGTAGGPAVPGVVPVRAAAFRTGWNPTNVDTQTYVFLDHVITQSGAGLPDTWGYGPGQDIRNPAGPDYAMDQNVVNANMGTIRNDLKSLPTVSLVTHMDNFFAPGGVGIYPVATGVERPVSVEYFNADGSQEFQLDGGVEIVGEGFGGTSGDRWKTYKLSMQLKFKSIYGDPDLEFPLFGADAASSFDTLILDAQINNTWLHTSSAQRGAAMYVQDQFVADIQNAMSGGAGHGPQGKFVHLYLNGIYWGVYDLHERPDEHFGSDYYGGEDEDYDVIKHSPSNVGSGTNAAYNQLLGRVRADVTNLANYDLVEQMLDVDDFIDYMIANYYAGNTDWAHKNWYATFNRVDPGGRWRFHSWDAEHVMTSGQGSGQVGPMVDVTGLNNSGGPTEIHQRLVLNAEYRARFADRVNKHFFNGGALTPENAAATYQARVDEVYHAMVAESARWGDNRRPSGAHTRDEWFGFQQRLFNEFFPVRTQNVLNQFRARGWYPSVSAPTFSQHGGTFPAPVQVTISNPGGGTIYYMTDGADPRQPGGTLHPNAQLYLGAVEVYESTYLRARVFDGANWSALTEAPFIIGPPPALRVTEIMYNPAPPAANSTRVADDYEFIELQNLGSTPLKLDGFGFRRGIDFTFDEGTTLAPGARIVLVRNAAAFAERYPGVTIGGVYSGSLANGGERLILSTHVGQVIQNFEYKDAWYSHTDGEGFSLVAVNPLATNALLSTKDGWRPSGTANGGPGVADPGIPVGSVVVNEILSNPTTPGTGWIELRNTTDAPIEVGGWYLSDDADNLRKYQIQPGTTIPANGFITFGQDTHFGVTGGPGVLVPFALSGLGGDVHLSNNDGTNNPAGYRDSVDFGAASPGVSFGRHVKSTGEADFYAMSASSRGEANVAPRVGPIVINEIMYGPAGTGHEFIELRNTGASAVSLFDPANPANTWKFTDGVTFAFPQNASIPAGAYALVVGIDPALFRSTYNIPQGVQIFGPYTGNLDNAGEKLELSMPGTPPAGGAAPYIVVDRVHYANVAPWPTSPNATGPSLARRLSTSYGNDVANWAASPSNGGTPGASNGDIDADPPAVNIIDVTPDPRRVGINSLTIIFNEPVTGFDVSDLTLTRNGGANLLTSQLLSSGDGRTWTLNGLAGLTGAAGTYVFTLNAAGSGIKDGANNFLADGATDTWSVDLTAPTVDVVDVTPDPRGTAVNQITIAFSEVVSNFDIADLRFTRDGGNNLLTAAQTITSTDGGRTFVLGNLADLTGASGTYTLSVVTNGGTPAVADAAGNALAIGASDTFVVDATDPTVTIENVSEPRTTPVNTITITFSEPVSGFDLADLTLTRDGGANLLTAAQTLTPSGERAFVLGNLASLTGTPGVYTLTLTAAGSDIVDGTSRPLTGDGSETFAISTDPPFVVTGTNGNDTFYLRRNGGNIEVFDNATGAGAPILVASFANTPRVRVDALGGDDVIILDAVNGDVMPGVDNTIDAGDGDDTLRVINAPSYLRFEGNQVGAGATLRQTGIETMQLGAGSYALLDLDVPHFQLFGDNGLVHIDELGLTGTTRLDLGTNDLEIGDMTVAEVKALVASARNGSPTRWQGQGIGTSAAGPVTGLAVISAPGGTLVKYTYNGDANADGRVNADDYFRIDQGFLGQPANPAYAQGDFNFDGKINADDYFLIDQAFLGQSTQLGGSAGASPASASTATAAMASPVVVTEEPTKKSRRASANTTSLFSKRRIARKSARAAARG